MSEKDSIGMHATLLALRLISYKLETNGEAEVSDERLTTFIHVHRLHLLSHGEFTTYMSDCGLFFKKRTT